MNILVQRYVQTLILIRTLLIYESIYSEEKKKSEEQTLFGLRNSCICTHVYINLPNPYEIKLIRGL